MLKNAPRWLLNLWAGICYPVGKYLSTSCGRSQLHVEAYKEMVFISYGRFYVNHQFCYLNSVNLYARYMEAIGLFLRGRYYQVKVKRYFNAYLLKGDRMQGIVCLGDATNHGGKVITASSTMFINGIQVALVGDMVSCPLLGHGINPIIEGAPTDTEDGVCVVVDNCLCACGCRVISSHPENCVES